MLIFRWNLESAGCEHCDVLPLRTLLVFPGAFGPAVAEAQRRLQSWGSQINLSAELETGTALSMPSPDRFSASSQGGEAHAADSSAPDRGTDTSTI